MRLFGDILPFIGFQTYYLPVDHFREISDEYFSESYKETLLEVAEEYNATHVVLRSFEAEWFGYMIGKIYRAGVFVERT